MVSAFILIQTEVGRASNVTREISGVKGIVSVDPVTGPYDVIARGEAADLDELAKAIVMRSSPSRVSPRPDLPGALALARPPTPRHEGCLAAFFRALPRAPIPRPEVQWRGFGTRLRVGAAARPARPGGRGRVGRAVDAPAERCDASDDVRRPDGRRPDGRSPTQSTAAPAPRPGWWPRERPRLRPDPQGGRRAGPGALERGDPGGAGLLRRAQFVDGFGPDAAAAYDPSIVYTQGSPRPPTWCR